MIKLKRSIAVKKAHFPSNSKMNTSQFRATTDIQTPSTTGSQSPMEQQPQEAVFAPEPVEIQVMANAADEPGEDEVLEHARVMDAVEEAQRSGEAYDQGDEEEYDEYDAYGCHCMDCLNHDDPNYVPYYADERDYDGGAGLDWNESGYFD